VAGLLGKFLRGNNKVSIEGVQRTYKRVDLDCAAKKNYKLYHGQYADVVNRVMEGFQRGIWGGWAKKVGIKQMKRRLVRREIEREVPGWEVEIQKGTEFSDSLDNDNLATALTQRADAVWSFCNRGTFGAWPLSKKVGTSLTLILPPTSTPLRGMPTSVKKNLELYAEEARCE
jgi:hypothetical protein